MFKINKYYLLLIFPVLTTFSCKKLLNPEPTDLITTENYYSTESELQIALTGVYDKLSSLDIYGNNQSFWLTFSNDESTSRLSLTSEPASNYTLDPTNPRITNFWKALYEGIDRANLLLSNINKPVMDDTNRKYIEGEALFLRAYYYFLLVSSFGDVPLKLSPTTSITDTDIPKSTSKQVYEQIIADMTKAEGLVQDVVKYDISGAPSDNGLLYAGRVTKSAVQGILARVCLTMAGHPVKDASKYQLALDWALKVKNSGRHKLNPDYSDVFIKMAQDKYDTQESIWEVEFYGNNTGGYQEGSQATGNLIGILNNVENNPIGYSAAYVRVSRKLYDAYDTKNGVSLDTRRDWNCPNFLYTNGVRTTQTNIWVFPAGKYRREYETVLPKDKNFSPINFPLLRYSDVLLMIAEADNEVNDGPTSVGIDAINEVRYRGYGKVLRGEIVDGISLTSQGTGYVAASTTVTISGGGGTGATATATVASGRVTAIKITDPGRNYTHAPTITINGVGSGAVALATISSPTSSELLPEQTANKDQFFEAVQNERFIELCFEGLRKPDLIRWGVFYDTMKNFVTYSNANGGTSIGAIPAINLAPRHEIFPIPSREITLNKALVQNLGW